MRSIYSIILFVLAMDCHADSVFHVSRLTENINNSSHLGNLHIQGVGTVNLFARKNGNQIIIRAQDPDGKVIGKAETVAGLKETPIYISVSGGLEKVTIYWGTTN
ncbi:hypothetical protein [uncultured Paraglaciecola sp.]|jgi:hypothetical protein|uniref:hypothetical protein n=1 Tax=uncultured Paraglaciecola sp. TaxID=1765024 RepID=UPI00262BC1BF|nr:hypothetical protein [uncultured Paraglaciecola sp.]